MVTENFNKYVKKILSTLNDTLRYSYFFDIIDYRNFNLQDKFETKIRKVLTFPSDSGFESGLNWKK